MNIAVSNTNLNIDRLDSFKLSLMANAVLKGRSTYSYIPANIAGERVEVFTRLDGDNVHARRQEKLFIIGENIDIRLDSSNEDELKQILVDIKENL